MDDFLTFFERANRNPLRKQDLVDRGIPNKKEWVDNKAKELTPDEKREIKNLSRRKSTTEDHINNLKNDIEAKKKKSLENDYLRGKIRDDLRLVKKHRGVKIYVDQYIKNRYAPAKLVNTINKLFDNYGDIVPRRGFEVIISNAENNPDFATMSNIGDKNKKSSGYYQDRRIYIDDENVGNVELLLHEYAHFLAERIPSQTLPLIKKEYNRMLNSYFRELNGKRTGRKKLEGVANENHRRQMAIKMGLSEELSYASTNLDEWFAVLIENWKNLPNNKYTYSLKNLLKKILIRI
jgi:hypothetical protein